MGAKALDLLLCQQALCLSAELRQPSVGSDDGQRLAGRVPLTAFEASLEAIPFPLDIFYVLSNPGRFSPAVNHSSNQDGFRIVCVVDGKRKAV